MTMLTTRRRVPSRHVPTVEEKEAYEALWWLPEEEDNRVPGRLTIYPEQGIRLDLNGSFTDPLGLPDGNIGFPIVKGMQYSGARFTLLSCDSVQQKTPFGSGFPKQQLAVDTALVGCFFDSLEEVQFERFYFQVTHLKDWMRNVGLNRPEEKADGFKIEYDPSKASTVPELRAELQRGTISITSEPIWEGAPISEREVSVKIRDQITVDPKDPVGPRELVDSWVSPLNDLLCLATTTPNSLIGLKARHPDWEEDNPKGSVTIHPTSVHQRFPRFSLFNKGRILFNAHDIESFFDKGIRQWMKTADELQDVFSLFFGVHYNRGMRPVNRFLNVVQSVEVYHRIRHGDANLGNMLPKLIDKCPPSVMSVVPAPDVFTEWAVESRNYYTHRTDKSPVAEGENLVILTGALMWIMRVHLMYEFGFSVDQCEEALDRNQELDVVRRASRQMKWS